MNETKLGTLFHETLGTITLEGLGVEKTEGETSMRSNLGEKTTFGPL
jgi:hypothetical protein